MRAGVLAVLLVLIARPGLAQVGAPVEGQAASAGPAGVFVGWSGTDDDPGHEVEGAALGGFTLLGASAAGGPVTTPSSSSIRALDTDPPGAEKPPILPPAAVTRWQGMISGTGFAAMACPTSRAYSGPAPSSRAMAP